MPSSRYPRQPADRTSLLLGCLSTVGRAIFWLATALAFSIALEWLSLALWRPEAGARYSEQMLAQELTYLNEDFRQSLLTSDPARYAERFMAASYIVLFQWTRLERVLRWLNEPARPNELG
jgi:hypothetical protein